ncbi:MAG TPA: SagB family peptide dehydrogenase [Candidatus Sulfotelmatobacter sp.]|nr:SagB family peptide dehydrogenase [Candidatus Sulfotelmatobacter sp.]
MSENQNVDAARQYHSGTKHSYLSIRMHPHVLDWENKPLLFKIYPTLEVTRLPRDFQETGRSALDAIADVLPAPEKQVIPDLETLAQVLFFSAGVTRSQKHDAGETFFRAAACTGALYEIELYVVCRDLQAKGQKTDAPPALPAGVYHFGAAEFGLRQLRAGDFRHVIVEATGTDPSVASAPVVIVCTGTYWRNAWKYHSRTYRHFGWDNGTILANLLAISSALDLPAWILTGFVDSDVNALLGLDVKREVAFSMVSLGHENNDAPSPPALATLDLPTVAYSAAEVDYPAMRRMHAASSLETPQEVSAWRAKTWAHPNAAAKGALTTLTPLDDAKRSKDTIEQVISRRGSTRQFSRDAITVQQLSTLLDRSTRGIPADFLNPRGTHLNDLYLIVNNVIGLAPGGYFYRWQEKELEMLKPGEFRDKAGYLGLEQQLPADAAVDVFFLADLKNILETYGNRGYRAVQLEAGILGGKMYLAAYAQKFGCTGLTFYDDDVVSFFSPHARGKSAIFLIALGRSAVRT